MQELPEICGRLEPSLKQLWAYAVFYHAGGELADSQQCHCKLGISSWRRQRTQLVDDRTKASRLQQSAVTCDSLA